MPEKHHDINFQAIKKGDHQVYKQLFYQMYDDLVKYTYRITRNETASEEIIQDIFLYVWDKREKIEIHGSLASYLYQAAKNRSINWLKNELPKMQATIEVSEVEMFSDSDDTVLDEETIKLHVEQAIDQLPEKCREIFVLSRYAGLTYKEIAMEMDLSVKTIENQMNIAFKKLRESLKPLMDRMKNDG